MNLTRNIHKGLWNPTDKYMTSKIFFRRESFFVLAVSILFSIIAGLRILGLDRDYYQYLGGWQELAQGYGTRWEPFFEFLATTIQSSFGDESFHFFLLIVAFIGLSIKLNIFSKNKHFALVSFIYLVMLFPIHEMTQVRVALGIAFAYLGLYKATFEKSSFLVRLSYAILAAGSHFSMLVLVPFILIPKIAYLRSSSLILLLGASSIVLFPILIQFATEYLLLGTNVGTLLDFYINVEVLDDSTLTPNPFSLRAIVFVLLLLIGIYNLKVMPSEALPWFYISFFGVVSYYVLSFFPTGAHRLFELTMISNLVWATKLPGKSKTISLFLLLLFGIYSFAKLFILTDTYFVTSP
tara:strand:- start:22828 stop:23883 length:1056 start_codon:yes stop_codon:yes gene_type:complete